MKKSTDKEGLGVRKVGFKDRGVYLAKGMLAAYMPVVICPSPDQGVEL
jgi:hypothetical protein